MKLLYLANARLPTEKAHGLQIVQNCEAFAAAGAETTLIYRRQGQLGRGLITIDPTAHYGVEDTFDREQVGGLNLFSALSFVPKALLKPAAKLANALLIPTWTASLLLRLRRTMRQHPDAICYTRDAITAAAIARVWPARARQVFYEAHSYPASGLGQRLRADFVPRIGGVVAVTAHLADRFRPLIEDPSRLIVEHDGYRAQRFEIEGDRAAWRAKLGLPGSAFIVGYMGRFHTMGMSKGLDTLVEAILGIAASHPDHDVRLGLVGGPAETVDELREMVRVAGLPPETIWYGGQVPAPEVPGYLRAFDVAVMPLPWTEHFAYYASPLKLFEYMASGTVAVATDLPSTAEVLHDDENGLLFPPSDSAVLAAVLTRLLGDPALRAKLAAQALDDVTYYTWRARARRILNWIESLCSR